MHEVTTLEQLHAAGASVPRPFAHAENAILMSYIGDGRQAAPLLAEVRLDPEEAEALLGEALSSIRLMLERGLIHGDLSAYNILYWEGAITLIDFPQVVDSQRNSDARSILRRDLTRLCEYFARQGAMRDPARLFDALWKQYGRLSRIDLEREEAEGLERRA
jgi:RIO kinase 1